MSFLHLSHLSIDVVCRDFSSLFFRQSSLQPLQQILKRFLYMEEHLLQSIKHLRQLIIHLQQILQRFLYMEEHLL
jgi:hypothetical protein